MAQPSLLNILRQAKKERWALAQFNFSTAEQLRGIVQAALAQRAPLLVGTSEGDSGFFGLHQSVALVEAWRKQTKIPVFLNLDHGKSVASIEQALKAGYSAVHFDGSQYPLEENISLTKQVMRLAKKYKVDVVEGELTKIPGSSEIHKQTERPTFSRASFTKSEDAERFVKETKVTSLAVAFGNAHGVFAQTERLELGRLQEIQKRVQCFLVLHGGSGITPSDVLQAIKIGIVKINVSTDIRSAFTQALRKSLARDLQELTPYAYLPATVEAVQRKAEELMKFYGSAGKRR